MTESDRPPSPPKGLASAGRRLWRSAVADYELDTHEQLLLLQACRVADVLDRLAAAAEDAPLTVFNAKGDEISNPVFVESRQQSIVFARLLTALRMPAGDEEGGTRPQRRGIRGVYQPRRLGSVG